MFDLTLTFDNGPDPAVTPAVLGVLEKYGVAATFFVVGQKAARPEGQALCARAYAAGHWIGNHTWSHLVPLGEQPGADVAEAEIGRTQALIAKLAHPRRYFRPFGGGGNLDRRLLSAPVLEYLRSGGYSCVLWNAVPRDWADPDGWVETALEQCEAQPWTLMVLHDVPSGAMRQLPRFLDAVLARGGRLRQDFPPCCVPLRDGRVVSSMEAFVSR